MSYLFTLLSITPEMITMVSNIVLIVLIAIVLIGGIVGLVRGVWKSTFRMIFIGGLVVLSYLFASKLGTFVAEFNLTTIVSMPAITISSSSSSISVPITSIKETLINIIVAYSNLNGGALSSINNPEVLSLVTEIAMMIIRFVTFTILATLVIVVGNFLATLLYHIIFKHLIPKKVRDNIKLRIIGCVEGMVTTILVLSMLVVPVSSVFNSVVKSFNNSDEALGERLDNETYRNIMSMIDAYNDSYLAKYLFDWTKNEDGNTLDMQLINYITGGEDSSIVFTDEITSLLTVGTTLIGSGAVGFNSETNSPIIDMTILLNSEIVSLLVAQLTTSNLVMGVLPIAASIAFSSQELEAYFDDEKINLDNIDWGKDLNKLAEIYADLYEKDIINQDAITQPMNIVKKILDVTDESMCDVFTSALESFDDVSILSQVLPSLLWTMSNLKDESNNYVYPLHEYLPTEWEDLKDIKFGKELATIYDSIYRVNKVTQNAIVDLLDNSSTSPTHAHMTRESSSIDENASSSAMQEFLSKILENVSDLVPIIVGERVGGELVNVDENGVSVEGRCLLDSELLTKSFSKFSVSVVDLLISSLGQSLEIEFENQDIQDAVESIVTRRDIKNEFGTLLEIVGEIFDNEEILNVIRTSGTLVLSEEICNHLKTPLSKVDNSKIFKATMPQLLKAMIEKNATLFEDFGITTNSIYYDLDSYGQEFVNILDLVPSIGKVSSLFNGTSIDEAFNEIESEDIVNLLSCINKSEIFNHDFGAGQKRNFDKVVDMLFEKLGYPTNICDDLNTIHWTKDDWNIQINHIGNLYEELKLGGFTSLFTGSGTPDYLNRDVLNPDSIVSLFDVIDASMLLQKGVSGILDSKLSGMFESIGSTSLAFSNISNWSDEGRNFASLIENLQVLNDNNITIENIDFLNSDLKDENGKLLTHNIVEALSQTQLFENKTDFSEFIKSKLTGISGIKFSDLDNPSAMTKTDMFFNQIDENNAWDDELTIIFNFIEAMQNIGKDGGSITNPGSAGLNMVLDAPQNYKNLFIADGTETVYNIENYRGINSSQSLRMVVANAIKDSATQIATIDSINLNLEANLNVMALVNMDDEQARNDEMSIVFDILDTITNLPTSFNDLRNSDEALNSLKEAVIKIHGSKMFNTLNELNDVAETTVFETLIAQFIANSGIGEDAIIGKVNASIALRYDTAESVVKSIKNNRGDVTLEDEWLDEVDPVTNALVAQGEISKLFEIISSSKNVEFNSASDTGWLKEKGEILLPLIDSSKLLYRAVPYFLEKFLSDTDTTAISTSFNLGAANALYTYNPTIEDYEPMGSGSDNSEINKLITIIDGFTTIKDLMAEGFSIQSINEGENLQVIEDTLVALSNSMIFHLEGSDIIGTPTVFIQMMEEMFIKSSISNIIYDTSLFGEYYGTQGISNATSNTTHKIEMYDMRTKSEDNVTWSDEINNIMNIFTSFTSIDSSMNQLENINVQAMTPDQITNTFKVINESELCHDAVPIYVKTAFGNVNMSTFSENKENYLPGGMDSYRQVYQTSELDTLGEILNSLCTVSIDPVTGVTSTSYLDFASSGFSVENHISSDAQNEVSFFEAIIRFLLNSEIFKNCRGLVLKNAIDTVGFGSYVSARYDGLVRDEHNQVIPHSNVFDEIFKMLEEEANDPSKREGRAINNIVSKLKDAISSSTSAGSNSLTAINSDDLGDIYSSIYEMNAGERELAYLASEIITGFIQSAIIDSEYLDDDYMANLEAFKNLWFKSADVDFMYPNVNDLESNSIREVVSGIEVIRDITSNYANINSTTSAQISHILASLYDENDNNSQIATYVYEKGMYTNIISMFDVVNTIKMVIFTNPDDLNTFNTNYNLMKSEAYSSAQHENFKFSNVHAAIDNIMNVIAALHP